MKRLIYFALSILLIMIFPACGKKTQAPVEQETVSVVTEGIEAAPHWTNEEGIICVLFAYGFNTPEFYAEATEKLGSIYGVDPEGGLLYFLQYPDDLKSRINNLYSMLDGKKIRGLIVLGAPEGTHYVLARFQDAYEGGRPFPVFSLFPQDNVLGQESTCDFVLEYETSVEEESVSEEITQEIDENAEAVVIKAVAAMADLKGPLANDSNLHQYVQNMVGETLVQRYTDRETGIQSSNHFVMERK
jgi:hypothetical protein